MSSGVEGRGAAVRLCAERALLVALGWDAERAALCEGCAGAEGVRVVAGVGVASTSGLGLRVLELPVPRAVGWLSLLLVLGCTGAGVRSCAGEMTAVCGVGVGGVGAGVSVTIVAAGWVVGEDAMVDSVAAG